MRDKECCGLCRFHWKDDSPIGCVSDGDWYCGNTQSEWYGEYTPYEHECEDFEERD